MREFTQCDIDILGSDSPNCEIELIHTAAKALLAIGIDHFKVKVNDRRILRSVLSSVGFAEDDLDSVCISFDKLGKIGPEGVKSELESKGFDDRLIGRFMELIAHGPFSLDYVKSLVTDAGHVDGLSRIIEVSRRLADGRYEIEYDMTHMGYNTVISSLMILANKYDELDSITKDDYRLILILLNPIAPHITEELNERLGYQPICEAKWPEYDENKTIETTKEIAVQVNGKVRATIKISIDDDENTIKEKAMECENVIKHIADKEIVKVIVIKGKIVNIVVK